MATRKYVSDIEASYFKEHQLHCFNAPPKTGVYAVGDVVISNSQLDDIFGWVCVEAGEPGVWEVIVDLSLIKAAIKALQEKDLLHDSLIETLRKRIETIYDELKNEDKSHRDELNNINNRIQDNTDNITELSKEINNINGNNTSLETELKDIINSLTTKVNTNSTNIDNNMGNIEKLQNEIKENTKNILINSSDIFELEKKVGNNTNTITNNTTGINKLEDRVNDHADDISNILSLVNTNATDINNNKKDISDLKNKVNTNTNNIISLSGSINTNAGNILNNTTSISELEERVNNHEGELDEIQQKVETNTNSLIDINNRLIDIESIDLSLYQLSTDDTLNTESKTIVGAINELHGLLFELKNIVDKLNTGENEGGENPGESEETEDIPCEGIVVDDVTINGLSGASLSYRLSPSGCTDVPSFSISDKTIATISGGWITAKSIGSTTITGTCGGYSDSGTITINPVSCTGLTCTESLTLDAGDASTHANVSCSPNNCTDVISASSSNSSVATVYQGSNGSWYIQPAEQGSGSCTITFNCGSHSATCNVTVNAVKCTGIEFTSSGIVYLQSPYNGSGSVTFRTTPSDATESVSFSINDTSIVTGSYNPDIWTREISLTGKKVGTTTITVRCGSASASMTIEVKETV